jgi:hypothetical protein
MNILSIIQNKSSRELKVIGEFNVKQDDNVYPSDLKQFLRKLSPILMKELNDNFVSKALT